ncbi:MAG: peptidoglycan editing factor PgeF [Gallionella sp.]|nr:peptidoglycan editing factor PgeF [Gallionella sp.]
MNPLEHCIIPGWPAPARVKAIQTTRQGGVSAAPYDSLNLGNHVGDNPLAVERNRILLNKLLPSEPVWLEQIHGTLVANADRASCQPQADACIARHRESVCAVMTADCLPVLLCDAQGSVVGAAHAGWRGLCDGVIEATVLTMSVAPQSLMAWLGPAISQEAFEVGEEVRAAFVAIQPQAALAFTPGQSGKWFADIYALARLRLNALGVTQIYGGGHCTYREREQFFSYRRDGVTGRMGTFIWLER